MQKGQTQVLIVAGIVLFIAVAGGIFFLGRITAPKPQTPVVTSSPQPSPTPQPTSTSDPTANWKTYTNTKYGYSLKYPQEFKLEEENYEGISLTYLAPGSYPLELSDGAIMGISIIRDKTSTQAVYEMILEIEKFGGGIVTDFSKPHYSQIDNKPAIFYTYLQKTYLYTTSLFINLNNNVLKIGYTYGGPGDMHAKYINWRDQILSTFKFLP